MPVGSLRFASGDHMPRLQGKQGALAHLSVCAGTSAGHASLERVLDPSVHAHAAIGGRARYPLVQLLAEAHVESAGERLSWFDAILITGIEVFVDGSVELCAKSNHVGRLEGGDRVGAAVDDPSVQTSNGIVELDFGNISLVFHHGCTPTAARYLSA